MHLVHASVKERSRRREKVEFGRRLSSPERIPLQTIIEVVDASASWPGHRDAGRDLVGGEPSVAAVGTVAGVELLEIGTPAIDLTHVRIPEDLGACSGVMWATIPEDVGAIGAQREGSGSERSDERWSG